jgi:hypothetical protein
LGLSNISKQVGKLFERDPLASPAATFAGWARLVTDIRATHWIDIFAHRQAAHAIAMLTGGGNMYFDFHTTSLKQKSPPFLVGWPVHLHFYSSTLARRRDGNLRSRSGAAKGIPSRDAPDGYSIVYSGQFILTFPPSAYYRTTPPQEISKLKNDAK